MKQLCLLFAFVGFLVFNANAQKAPLTTTKATTELADAKGKVEALADAKTISKLAAQDESIEERVCAKSGKVSYFQKSVCPTSGKVSMNEVQYCNKSKGFVKTVANTEAPVKGKKVCTKGEKKSCAKKCTKAEKAACSKSKKACSKGKKACNKSKKSCSKAKEVKI